MNWKTTYHPPGEKGLFKNPPYYIEFTDWDNGKPETWRFFRRQYLMEEAQYLEFCKQQGLDPKDDTNMLKIGSIEVHPWQLSSGDVADVGLICMETKQFLCLMVDALNEKYERERK